MVGPVDSMRSEADVMFARWADIPRATLGSPLAEETVGREARQR